MEDKSNSPFSSEFIENLENEDLFTLINGDFENLKLSLEEGEIGGLIVIPENFEEIENLDALKFYVDASQARQASIIKQAIDRSLVSIERNIRNMSPLFSVELEDVKSRNQRYIDFLLPGLLAFMIMNLSIAGSGFNIVEYRGILKRLFVTPIKPRDFMIGIVLARMAIVLVQLSVVLSIALLLLDINIIGSYISFLFCCDSRNSYFFMYRLCTREPRKDSRRHQARCRFGYISPSYPVWSIFPISSMPELVQPIVYSLPLSSVVSSLREIANDGASLFSFSTSTIGLVIWVMIAFLSQ